MFTAPEKISSKILEFCRSIAPDSTPVYVPVFTSKHAASGNPFHWVNRYVRETGKGRGQAGWIIWEWPDVALEAEHNCVYDAMDGGSLRELGLHSGRRILFLPDNSATYDVESSNWTRKSVRAALRAESLIHEYLGTLEMSDDFIRENLEPFDTLSDCDNPRTIAHCRVISGDLFHLEQELLRALEFGFVSSDRRKAA